MDLPGCELADWHPHCTSVVDKDGSLVDIAVFPRDEWVGLVVWCGYLDLSLTVPPEGERLHWRCPQCGGTEYELVHAD